MSKLSSGRIGATLLGAGLAIAAAAPAAAAVLGPDAAACRAGAAVPALLVHVEGFKARTGDLRVQLYGGNPETYFDKGAYLRRIEVPVTAAGPLAVCMPVPRDGRYAVSVRHDVNGSGKADRSDGGGMSGNPRLSLFDIVFKRKPDPAKVAVVVHGLTPITVVLNYVQGGSFRPLAS